MWVYNDSLKPSGFAAILLLKLLFRRLYIWIDTQSPPARALSIKQISMKWAEKGEDIWMFARIGFIGGYGWSSLFIRGMDEKWTLYFSPSQRASSRTLWNTYRIQIVNHIITKSWEWTMISFSPADWPAILLFIYKGVQVRRNVKEGRCM